MVLTSDQHMFDPSLTFCFTFLKSSTRNRLQRCITYSLCQAERCQSRTWLWLEKSGALQADESEPAAAA